MVKKTKDSISVGLIVFGAFVAGARDMSYESYGYVIVLLANLATAIYLATIARVGKIYIFTLIMCRTCWISLQHFFLSFVISGKSSGLNSFGLMWCNGMKCWKSIIYFLFSLMFK